MKKLELLKKNAFERFNSTVLKVAAVGAVAAPFAARADAPPLDLTATATTIAGYVGTAATAGLVLFSAVYGLRMMLKAFGVVGKKG